MQNRSTGVFAVLVALGGVAWGGCNQLFGIDEGVLIATLDAGGGGGEAGGGDGGAGEAGGGACTIGGATYAAGAAKAGDGCQTCQPSVSATSWSAAVEGTECGTSGVCHAGGCVSGCDVGGVYFTPDQVDPGNGCQVCKPTVSRSQWTARTGADCGAGQVCNASGACVEACLIGGKTYASGDVNPANQCESCQPAKTTTGWSAATTCGGTAGGTCVSGLCIMPASCAPGGAGMTNCGPGGAGTESCCTSLEVPKGAYFRTYTNDGNGAKGTAAPASVSGFRLDKYEVTVGRFRQFVAAYNNNTWTNRVTKGAGKHTHLNGGQGLANSGAAGGFEGGWDDTSNGNVAPTDAHLTNCGDGSSADAYATWTASAGGNENKPINCVNWWEAEAFCVWDGGFLPSEAEWEYAAAGGNEQRRYPWGTADPGTASSYATYGCNYPSGSGSCSGVTNIAAVGYASQGEGKWHQLDLAGNVFEWNLDGYATYASLCTDCASVTSTSSRVLRGGGFDGNASYLLPPSRSLHAPPADRYSGLGLRCARTP